MRGRMDNMYKSILVIAGSDSIAGAGMQIDLKVACVHGVYASTAITAVTSQNTLEVTGIVQMPAEAVSSQIEAVFADVPPDAVKIGMLGSAEAAEAVCAALERHPGIPVVLDPVLVATSGGVLSDPAALIESLGRLLPLCTVVTPNAREAEQLSGIALENTVCIDRAADYFIGRGAKAVLIKGGHATPGDDPALSVDRLYAADGRKLEFSAPRLPGEFHGTGCSTSTAIACNLALGCELGEAVEKAHAFIAAMLAAGPAIASKGTLLVNPFFRGDADPLL